MSDPAPLAAVQHFLGCCSHFQLRRIERVGFSGSDIWQVTGPASVLPLCLKRWPVDHPPPARLPCIHRVLKQAREAGLDFVPELVPAQHGGTTCELAGSTWELMTWLPGEVDRDRPTSESRIAAAFRALAQFHRATGSASDDSTLAEIARSQRFPTPHIAPAIADRIRRFDELHAGRWAFIRSAVVHRRIPPVDDLAQRWLNERSIWPREMVARLRVAAQSEVSLQPAIRDLWRDHVLFTGTGVSGFLDFGAMRIDTPLTDLARLSGSLAGDDLESRQAALRAYSEVRPLSSREIELVDLLDHSGTFIAGWNWLDWLYVEQREFPSLAAVRERLSELLGRRMIS